jgi:hypothetical protein
VATCTDRRARHRRFDDGRQLTNMRVRFYAHVYAFYAPTFLIPDPIECT